MEDVAHSLPSIRYLRVFDAVARLESVTRAAAEVGLTQPAVTQAIAKLELELGEQLFDRRTTGTYLTALGGEFAIRVHRFFRKLEQTLVEIGLPDERAVMASRLNRITRSQIRCHLAIARGRSFTHAAALIGMSQASLHRAARDLERNVGAPLYRHTASGIIVTEAGQRLAIGVLAAIKEIEQALSERQAERGIAATRIAVGTPMLDPAPFVASVLDEFTRAYPNTSIQVVNRTFEELRRSLRSGALDLMVGVLKEQDEDLCDEPLFTDRYVIAVRASHPLAGRTSVTAEDLLAFDWIIPNKAAPRWHVFENLFDTLGREPRANIESHSLATIRAMLYESDRLAILTRMEVSTDEKLGLLRVLPVGELDPSPVIGVTTRRDWMPTPGQQAFLDLVRKMGKSRTPPRASCEDAAIAIA